MRKDLLDHVKRNPVTGCWEWQGPLKDNGYARKCDKGRERYAHRLSYERFCGPAAGVFVCHRCDNKKCINPTHLFAGTQKDNMQDASRKGILKRGPSHYNAKLTPDDIRRIRARVAAGELQRVIAADYNISRPTVSQIAHRKRWAHLT